MIHGRSIQTQMRNQIEQNMPCRRVDSFSWTGKTALKPSCSFPKPFKWINTSSKDVLLVQDYLNFESSLITYKLCESTQRAIYKTSFSKFVLE